MITVTGTFTATFEAVEIRPIDPLAGYVGQPFSWRMEITGASTLPPHTWHLVNSPVGWAIDPNTGTVSGIGPAIDNVSFTIEVRAAA